MGISSPPSPPSSFDPALHLHSEQLDTVILDSESHSDELEALHAQQSEISRELTRKGIVIQHRAWNLSEMFRSDDNISPATPTPTPTRSRRGTEAEVLYLEHPCDPFIRSPPPAAKMGLLSSPTLLPLNACSDLPITNAKRKLDEDSAPVTPKRVKRIGPFIMDDEEENDGFLYVNFEKDTVTQAIETDTQSLYNDSSLKPLCDRPSTSLHEANRYNTHSQRTAGCHLGQTFSVQSCSGKIVKVQRRTVVPHLSYESMVAERSTTAPGRAKKSYYGIDIHKLLDDVSQDNRQKRSPVPQRSIEVPMVTCQSGKVVNPMWTEKYRARKFKDLIGDERTHRSVLRWLKGWDPIVFPGLARSKLKKTLANETEEPVHRKVMLLAGPPGLGKTTLAHVCAKQAGYEVLEINASDERSRDVVKGRIRDAVGTENVKSISVGVGDKKVRKAGRPVCVVVDEVDGVVSGTGGSGEGGFIKTLVDLVLLDQKNSNKSAHVSRDDRRVKKGDKFRILRPLILICNDLYHPTLRQLRTSSIAEIIHVRQAPLDKVVERMKSVFEKEGILCDGDGVRRLCEASWGLSNSRDRRANNRGVSEGDIRGILVAGEWISHKLRSSSLGSTPRLTRKWVEKHVLNNFEGGGASARGFGRGCTREIVERVFLDGAGFPNAPIAAESFQDPFSAEASRIPVGVSDLRKRHAISRLREMVDAAGEYDRCITDCFVTYPSHTYQDDTFLSKPNAAYDWLYFHDLISSKVYSNQDWELNPYLSQAVVAFHHLFASGGRHAWDTEQNVGNDEEEEHPFSGPKSDFAAFEAEKQNRAILLEFQSSFSAPLLRAFRSTEAIATELIPSLIRMLAPDIKPIVFGGAGSQRDVVSVRKESERALVKSAVKVMSGIGVTFEKGRVETETGAYSGWVYRMNPPLDTFVSFSKVKGTPLATNGSSLPVRYAIRQVLDQEYQKEILRRQSEAQQARYTGGGGTDRSFGGRKQGNYALGNNDREKENSDDNPRFKAPRLNGPKRDFFGRIIVNEARPGSRNGTDDAAKGKAQPEMKVWVSFHEGYSNAVRKRISLNELMDGL